MPYEVKHMVTIWSCNYIPGIYQEKMEAYTCTDTCMYSSKHLCLQLSNIGKNPDVY